MKKKYGIVFLAVLTIVTIIAGAFVTQPGLARNAPPKNVIVMISDGWGYNHIQAASYYRYGTASRQIYHNFPVKMAMTTYSADGSGYDPALAWSDFNYLKSGATDSASAATAMSTGVKNYDGTLGVDVNYIPLKHASQYAEEVGKATGVVSSVEFSHATPAGFVAHNVSRNNYTQIAEEMVMNSTTDVIMGTGHPWFDNNGKPRTTASYSYIGKNVWDAMVAGVAPNDADGDGTLDAWTIVQTKAEFQALMSGPTPERVVGVPQVYTTLQQARSGDGKAAPFVVPFNPGLPTLSEMSLAALNVLDNDPDGFFLMIEGGAVDWAGHANQSGRVIEEQLDFDDAVASVVAWVNQNSNWAETLLIVTGDHETGYMTGPGAAALGYWTPIMNNGISQVPSMDWNSGNHTNSLIPFFAIGHNSRAFKFVEVGLDPVHGEYIDNTSIGKLMIEMFK
jgi:alkaline phosphatase